jgi:hypothetical protein
MPQEALLHGPGGVALLDSLSAAAVGRSVTRKPVLPSTEEAAANPRSRSAKLRVFQKAGGPEAAASGGDVRRERKQQRGAASTAVDTA